MREILSLQVGRPAPLVNSRSNSTAPTPLSNHMGAGLPHKPHTGMQPQMPISAINNRGGAPIPSQQMTQVQPQVFNKFIQVSNFFLNFINLLYYLAYFGV